MVLRDYSGSTPGKRKPGKTILPPKGTLGTPGAAGGAGYVPPSDTPGSGPGGTGGTGTEGTGMGGTGYGSKGKGTKTSGSTASASSSTTSSYDKYLAQQRAEANKAKRKAANRYVDQAQTLGLQANALRTLLGLPHMNFGTGGAGRGPKGKGPKGVKTTTTTEATASTGANAWHEMERNPEDPRNRLKHPWQIDDGRGASGNRNKPKKGGLPPTNLPGGRRP